MKQAIAIVVLLTATAHAGELVKAPDGYKEDAAQATTLAQKANTVSHFGGARSLATSDAFVGPGGALFVTAVAGKVSSVDRNAAARFAVDELHHATTRAALTSSGTIVVDSWNTQTAADQKVVRGDLVWRDTASATTTTARILVVADDENVIAVTGECVNGKTADPACVKALESLDPGLPLAKRQDIALAAPGTPLSAPTADPDPQPSGPASGPAQPGMSETPSSMGHTPLPPMSIPTEKPAKDRRPVYVGLGIVVLAAAFWWNQRRRERFEKDSDD